MKVDDAPTAELPDIEGLRVAVAVGQFNASITNGLRQGALEWLQAAGVDVTVVAVPGAFELPIVCRRLAQTLWRSVRWYLGRRTTTTTWRTVPPKA